MDFLMSTVSDQHSPALQYYQEQQQHLNSNIVPIG